MAQVYDEPIVVRLTQPVRNMPIGTELGYRDVADAIAALGSAHYFEVVRTQDGDPIPPLTPEEIAAAEQAARNRAKARRLILGADLDPIIPGPDKVVVGTANGTRQVDVDTLGGDVDPELVEQRVSEELQGRNLLEGPTQTLPVMLFSPEKSATQSGDVTVTNNGGVTTIAGQHGQAWNHTAAGQSLTTPNAGIISREAGTVIVRATFTSSIASGEAQAVMALSGGTGFRMTVQRAASSAKPNYLQVYIGDPLVAIASDANVLPDNTPLTIAVAWKDGQARAFVNGTLVGTATFTKGTAERTTIYSTLSTTKYPYQVRSHLYFRDQLPDAEIARISAIEAAHTLTTGWGGGDLVLPAQRTVIGDKAGSVLGLRSPSNTVMDLAVSDEGTLTVDGREVGGATSSPLIVTKAGDDVTITTPLTGAGTLEIWTDHGDPGQNDVFNFANTKLDGTVIHANGDDPAPVRMPSAVGANHGYPQISAYTVAGHDKTTADLGSIYTDGTRQYTLLAISGDSLTFGYPYTVDGAGVTVPGTTAPAATLTHVSGGTNTANVPITTTAGISQLWPSTTTPDIRYVLDGRAITADGEYRGSVLQVMESYTILDYKGIIDWARANVGQSFAANRDAIAGALRISNIYTFREGGRCTLSTSLTAVRPVTLGNTGIIQAFKLDEGAGTLWRYLPGVKAKSGVDFAVPVNMTTYSTNIIYGPADYIDPAKPPSRYVDWLQSGSIKIVGFTAGYITDKTNTKDSDRATLPTGWDMRGTKKVYPVAISGVTLAAGEHRSFEAFRNYVAPHPSGATLVNVVEDAQATYVHIDFHQGVTGQAIPLPDHIGKNVTVLDSDGLTVANDTVDASGLTVTVPGTAGRAVVKLT